MQGSTSPSKNGFAPNDSCHRKPSSSRATADGDGRIGAVDAGRTQQLHREEGRQPVGLVIAVPRAIGALAGENLGAEPFARNARTLRGDRRRRGVREIAQRLPANGRVRIEQPVDRVHRRDLIASDGKGVLQRCRWASGIPRRRIVSLSKSNSISTTGSLPTTQPS